MLTTFLFSGMYHEIILMFLHLTGFHYPFSPNYSAQLSFFLWNGCLLLLEGVVLQRKTFVQISSKIPFRLKNVLVLMSVIPIAHWFLDDYVDINLYEASAVAFPKIRKL